MQSSFIGGMASFEKVNPLVLHGEPPKQAILHPLCEDIIIRVICQKIQIPKRVSGFFWYGGRLRLLLFNRPCMDMGYAVFDLLRLHIHAQSPEDRF